MSHKVIIKSRQVVFPEEIRPATLVLENGLIVSIEDYSENGEGTNYGDLAILPGAIDTHVHFNAPGRSEWEGWTTGTLAALAGGVTTVVDMPLNCIPSTVDLQSYWVKRVSTTGQLYCNVGFWGGAVPGNAALLPTLVNAGALGLKSFMSDPGTAEFANLDRDGLKQAMVATAAADSVLLFHAEWPEALKQPNPEHDPKSYLSWLATRPEEAEAEAIKIVVELAKETGCRCHIVHVASPEVLKFLEGSSVTCETCTHYLCFAAEEIPDEATNFKCAPPIRSKAAREGLWTALKDGRIRMVTSDHSPCPPDMKSENFLESWGGIAGVQMLLTATWSEAKKRGATLVDLARWTSSEPAKLAGLDRQRGQIAERMIADLTVFDPEKTFTVERLLHRHGGSPYEGRTWTGAVEATYLRGERVFQDGKVAPERRGILLEAPHQ